MRGPLPRTLIFRGVVEASGFLIDATLAGLLEARRRVLELWVPGTSVYRVPRGWLVRLPEPRRGLTLTPMPDNRLVLIAPMDHKFAKRSKVKVTDLNGQDFVLFERDVPTRKSMDKIFKTHGIEVRKVAEFDNIETIKRAVEVGFGLAIVPEPAVVEARKAGKLAVKQLEEKYWVRSVGVIHRSDRQ